LDTIEKPGDFTTAIRVCPPDRSHGLLQQMKESITGNPFTFSQGVPFKQYKMGRLVHHDKCL
jgi:hypothetical protein